MSESQGHSRRGKPLRTGVLPNQAVKDLVAKGDVIAMTDSQEQKVKEAVAAAREFTKWAVPQEEWPDYVFGGVSRPATEPIATHIIVLLDALDAAHARIARLEEALAPFSELAGIAFMANANNGDPWQVEAKLLFDARVALEATDSEE